MSAAAEPNISIEVSNGQPLISIEDESQPDGYYEVRISPERLEWLRVEIVETLDFIRKETP